MTAIIRFEIFYYTYLYKRDKVMCYRRNKLHDMQNNRVLSHSFIYEFSKEATCSDGPFSAAKCDWDWERGRIEIVSTYFDAKFNKGLNSGYETAYCTEHLQLYLPGAFM